MTKMDFNNINLICKGYKISIAQHTGGGRILTISPSRRTNQMKHGVLSKWKSYWYLQLKDPETYAFDKGFVRSKRKADVMKTAERWMYGSDGYTQCIDQLHIYDGNGRWRQTIASLVCNPVED